MTHSQRDWARQHPWFYCSDSRAIWAKVGEEVTKFTNFRALKVWASTQHDEEPCDEAYLTVGKVYDMHPNRRNDGFYVITDIDTRHYFDSLDSPADEIGFKSSDYWELVE